MFLISSSACSYIFFFEKQNIRNANYTTIHIFVLFLPSMQRQTILKMVIGCVILISALLYSESTNDKISNIIFIKKANIYIRNSSYQISYKINFSHFISNVHTLKNAYEDLNFLCVNTPNNEECVYYSKILKYHTNNMQNGLEVLNSTLSRNKRAILLLCFSIPSIIIAIIAIVAACFAYAKVISLENTIVNMQRDESFNRNLTRDHFTISNSTLQVMMYTYADIFENMNVMLDKLNRIENKSDNQKKISIIMQTVSKILDEHYRFINVIKDISLTKSPEHIINLIGMDEIVENLKTIRGNISGNNILLLDDASNCSIAQMLSVSNFKMLYKHNTLTMNIFLPVIEKNPQALFKPIPIPYIKNNNTNMLYISNNYILYNADGNQTNSVSTKYVDGCKSISNDKLLCDIWNQTADTFVDTCAITKFIDPLNENHCGHLNFVNNSSIIQIDDKTFYFFIFSPEKLYVTFGNGTKKTIKLEKSVLLSFYDEFNFIFMNKTTVLKGDIYGTLTKNIVFEDNIPTLDVKTLFIFNNTNKNATEMILASLPDIQNITHKLNTLYERSNIPIEKKTANNPFFSNIFTKINDIINYCILILMGFIIGICIILILLIILKLINKCN